MSCEHLTQLTISVLQGKPDKPDWSDPFTAVLRQKGLAFEAGYHKFLVDSGFTVSIPNDKEDAHRIVRTLAAMMEGFDYIYQSRLKYDDWGRNSRFS